jgi:hypothetical protein
MRLVCKEWSVLKVKRMSNEEGSQETRKLQSKPNGQIRANAFGLQGRCGEVQKQTY